MPSRTLLVQGLPTGSTAEALSATLRSLFGQYAGLAEVRPVAQRGLAFIDFSSEAAAAPALQGLHNFRLSSEAGGGVLAVSFARM
jgi:RNA recognition motif-containing protein